MYKLQNYPFSTEVIPNTVIRILDGFCIPFDPANTDYQQFKKDITNGVALQDATGTAITDITTFLGTLP